MPTDHRAVLAKIKRFDQLIAYLRDEMGWPIARDSFEDVDDLFYDFTADELGIDPKTAAKIESIKRLRPLSPRQRWGIFFVKFEPKKLPVVALRRILSQVALKKRASANSAERTAWAADDLLFVSNYGEGDERQISFAHFSQDGTKADLPILKVLGWNDRDTALHLDGVATELATKLSWPEDESNVDRWREKWRSAFTLRPDEVVKTSKALAVELAKLARRIRDRIRTVLAIETENGPVTKLMKAFQEALVHDLDAGGFADMYAQTIAYGLLSARVTNPKANTADGFAAQLPVTNPFLKELMETFLRVGGRKGKSGRGPGIDFDELGVSEVVELLDHAKMEAVVRDFGDLKPEEDPVTHFYELFLNEFDQEAKKRRGVFYTPRPVVSYIVRSVDELLRTEFGLEDGLADTTTWGEMVKKHAGLKLPPLTDEPGKKRTISPDEPFVQILDPATGTATFLVEVIDVIHRTLAAKWKQQRLTDAQQLAAWNDYVPKHLLPRLHAFELMMAPYAIAHMKIGLKLAETDYRFGTEERARIYLTNALEPWVKQLTLIGFDALAHEAAAVNEIKRNKRFTVVIGNPPYSNFGQLNRNPFILGLLDDYKRGLDERKINLDDDFIKFVRFAQWCLSEAQVGVFGFITNNIHLEGATHRQMRYCLAETFGDLRVVDLHGDGRKQQKGPGGVQDENVFDIIQGVAVSLFTKPPAAKVPATQVDTKDLIGPRSGLAVGKYEWLVGHSANTTDWERVELRPLNYFFVKKDLAFEDEYLSAPSINEVFSIMWSGIQTKRDSLTVGWSAEDSWNKVARAAKMKSAGLLREFELPEDGRDWKGALAIQDLRESGPDKRLIVEFAYRPLDTRFIYYTGRTKGWIAYPRKEASDHLLRTQNVALIVKRSRMINVDYFCHICVVNSPPDINYLADQTYFMPLYSAAAAEDSLFQRKRNEKARTHNVSSKIVRQLGVALGIRFVEDGAGDLKATFGPEDIFHYAYAVFHSPGYRSRYSEFLKIDFPRLPLTGNLDLFRALARLGGELVALHLLESPKLHQPVTESIGGRNPEVEKISWSKKTVWVDKAQTTGFKGVREDVWNFHIGGYQVCEKWLKDRKDRTLTAADIAHYHRIVIALSETIRLMREIDEVIEAHGGWPGAFQTAEAKKEAATVLRFKPRIVQPRHEERYVACVPLVPLKAAAGAFSDPQRVEDDNWEWVAVDTKHRLRPGMFVAQVVGKSMEPAIADGSYCLFAAPVAGTRQGKTVLVQLRDATDPETGERYTVKRYESEKTQAGDSWRHAKITLKPLNPDFQPIVLTGAGEGQVQVIAELVEVLR